MVLFTLISYIFHQKLKEARQIECVSTCTMHLLTRQHTEYTYIRRFQINWEISFSDESIVVLNFMSMCVCVYEMHVRLYVVGIVSVRSNDVDELRSFFLFKFVSGKYFFGFPIQTLTLNSIKIYTQIGKLFTFLFISVIVFWNELFILVFRSVAFLRLFV